ncbi:hypothetical protein M595_2806 [Lyngbya aestuarii BL J]|uniref:Uncharacterized protein n=1 Tax=Lyngbya aestuarii BL J TaxID=1348334 RepID=U7QJD9_9CYAN|nr:hypothetical protein M595_2806 [Lyngbya aestuarii BL J]
MTKVYRERVCYNYLTASQLPAINNVRTRVGLFYGNIDRKV